MIKEEDVKFPDIPFKKTALLVLLGLGLYFGYLYLVGFDSVSRTLVSVNIGLILVAMAVALLGTFFHSLGWWVLLREVKYDISIFKAFTIYMSTIFFINLIPSVAISGDLSRTYFLQKTVKDTRVDRSLAAILMGRLLEIVPTCLCVLLGVLYLIFYANVPTWVLAFCAIVGTGIGMAALLVFIASLNERLMRWMADGIMGVAQKILKGRDLSKYKDRLNTIVDQFESSMRLVAARKTTIVKALAFMIVAWAIDISVAYVAFAAIGFHTTVGIIVTIYAIMVILALIPTFLPGGLGFVDIIMTVLYTSMGVPESSAASATIILRLVSLWFLTAMGGFFTLYLVRKIGKDDGKQPIKPATDAK